MNVGLTSACYSLISSQAPSPSHEAPSKADTIFKAIKENHLGDLKNAYRDLDINTKFDKTTGLDIALSALKVDAINFFLRNGATIYPKTSKALSRCNNDNLESFLFLDLDINKLSKEEIEFLVSTAIGMRPNKALLTFLLNKGLDPNGKTSDGNSYLNLTIRFNHLELAELLLKHGASPNLPDSHHSLALHLALLSERSDIVALLLRYPHTDVNISNKNGETALHLAVRNGSIELVQLLINHGADARRLSAFGTPLYIAQDKNHQALIDLLSPLDEGATVWYRHLEKLTFKFSIRCPLEGSNKDITYSELYDCYTKFVETCPQDLPFRWSDENQKNVIQALAEAASKSQDARKMMEQLKEGKTVIIPCGWKDHSTAVIISGNTLIKANRGYGCGKTPGMKLFKIQKQEQLQNAIEKLIKNYNANEEKGKAFFNEKLNELLNLKYYDLVEKKGQTSGNCTWASAKLTLEAAILLELLKNHPEAPMDLLKENAHEIYSSFSSFYRFDAVKKIGKVTDLRYTLSIFEKIAKDKRLDEMIYLYKAYPEIRQVLSEKENAIGQTFKDATGQSFKEHVLKKKQYTAHRILQELDQAL
jgi:ankyrin repeat protein